MYFVVEKKKWWWGGWRREQRRRGERGREIEMGRKGGRENSSWQADEIVIGIREARLLNILNVTLAPWPIRTDPPIILSVDMYLMGMYQMSVISGSIFIALGYLSQRWPQFSLHLYLGSLCVVSLDYTYVGQLPVTHHSHRPSYD